MTAAHLAAAAYPLLICAGLFILGILCLAEARRERLAEATHAEPKSEADRE